MIIKYSFIINTFYCLIIQLITLVLSIEISKLFNIKIMEYRIINFYKTSYFNRIFSYLIFIISYLTASLVFFSIKGVLGLELLNLIFFFYYDFWVIYKNWKLKPIYWLVRRWIRQNFEIIYDVYNFAKRYLFPNKNNSFHITYRINTFT